MDPLPLAYAWCSLAGARSANEDALRVARIGEQFHLVLADGAGGHSRGAEAAKTVVDQIDDALAALAAAGAAPDPALLARIVGEVHDGLRSGQAQARPADRMHATVVVLWLDLARRSAAWAHVGDSRLYLLRQARVAQVSRDDSAVQLLVDAGVLDREAARRHPAKNRLLAALGISEDVDAHAGGGPLADGDAWLACTDGWWENLTDAALEASLDQAGNVSAWVEQMRAEVAAQAPPNQDNHSAVAVWVGQPDQVTRVSDAFAPTLVDATLHIDPLHRPPG